ncbi:MAG: hypothetical protein M0R46_13225 [Candidatus Muirbacterium halophilum]|nr:hypothetical protein [Candidatus Muirbacterium halophilum]
MCEDELLKIIQEEFYEYEVNPNLINCEYFLRLKGCKSYIINISYNKYNSDEYDNIQLVIGKSSDCVLMNIPFAHLHNIIKYYKKEINKYAINYSKMIQSQEILRDFNFNKNTIISQLIRDEKINKIV